MGNLAYELPSNLDTNIIADRYQIQETLGQGGMGAVYRVLDLSTGRILALKQLQIDAAQQKSEYVAFFQHEYYTLTQLSHPLIIEVYDYGIDAKGPYYTMELLPGNDLKQMAPLDWRQACELLRDVAIALAILHSRRLVHRDVSLRNVRCTERGRAKLIDFGAMAPMGIIKKVVGTAPFIPPEAITRQPIDGRADLYSLGAVAYYLLTGRYGYFSRKISGLIDAWRSRPTEPSVLKPDIPSALNNLVMALISLDKLARPINAAEVIDRLNAIASLPPIEPLDLSRAYLSTPPLVGRDRFTVLFRKMMPNLAASRGGTVIVQGPPGVGRSRLLSAFMLEGKLAGCTVIAASAEDARLGDYGIIRALLEDLLDTAPTDHIVEVRKEIAILGHEFPELHKRLASPELKQISDPQLLRSQIQVSLQSLFDSISIRRRIMIAVDDIHHCDEPSLAVLSSISRCALQLKLVLVVTTEPIGGTSANKAIQLIKDSGTLIDLEPLTRDENLCLIQSMFGEVPHADSVSDWTYRLSEGNIRICMELVQYLVDRDIARYEDGRWILPKSLHSQALPQSIEQALESRIGKLSEPARNLAETLSFLTENSPIRYDHYELLGNTYDHKLVFSCLDELVASQVLIGTSDHYQFSQPGLIKALHRLTSEERYRQVHTNLANLYQSGGYDRPLIVVHHLQQADRMKEAQDLLLQTLQEVDVIDEPYALQVQCYENALAELIENENSSPRHLFFIRMALVRIARKHDLSLLHHADTVADQLKRDTGLDYWDGLPEIQDPAIRVQQCLKLALNRWNSIPLEEQGLNPIEAIHQLAIFATSMAASYGPIIDVEGFTNLAQMVDPFRSISDAMNLLVRIIQVTRDQVVGHPVIDQRKYLEAATKDPIPGLEEEVRQRVHFINSYYLALEEANKTGKTTLERTDELEKDSRFAAHAWQVRVIHYLYNGNILQATACRKCKDLLAIQNPESDIHLLSGLFFEAWAFGINGDLMGLKDILVPINEKADMYPGWTPFMLAVRGEYHRLRGEFAQAKEDLEHMVELTSIGRHFALKRGIPVLIETLLDLEEYQKAYQLASQSLESFLEICPHPDVILDINRVLALAEAKLGNFQQAFDRIESAIKNAKEQCLGGVPLGTLYETGAWIALEAEDQDTFNTYIKHTSKQYKPGKNPALYAKLQRLSEESKKRDIKVMSTLDNDYEEESDSSVTLTATLAASIPPIIRDSLEKCQTAEQKAEKALQLLLEHTKSDEGFLYALTTQGLILLAPLDRPQRPGLVKRVEEYLSQILYDAEEDETTVTMTVDFDEALDKQQKVLISDDGYTFQPVVLSHQHTGISQVIGVAALRIRTGTPINPSWNLIATIGESILSGTTGPDPFNSTPES